MAGPRKNLRAIWAMESPAATTAMISRSHGVGALISGLGASARCGRDANSSITRRVPLGGSRDSPAAAALTAGSSSAGSGSLDQELPNCGGLDRGEARMRSAGCQLGLLTLRSRARSR